MAQERLATSEIKRELLDEARLSNLRVADDQDRFPFVQQPFDDWLGFWQSRRAEFVESVKLNRRRRRHERPIADSLPAGPPPVGLDSSQAEMSSALYRTAALSFKKRGPCRRSRHLLTEATDMPVMRATSRSFKSVPILSVMGSLSRMASVAIRNDPRNRKPSAPAEDEDNEADP